MRDIPPWMWVALVSVAGLAGLAWHRWANDDDDHDWTSAKEHQAPVTAAITAHGAGAPMSCGQAVRGRAYPASLAAADCSLVGG